MMHGIVKGYLNAAITAVLQANRNLLGSSVGEALSPAELYGKSDTLGLDAWPEISIIQTLNEHDPQAIVITEEKSGRISTYSNGPDPRGVRTFFISDPTDRSTPFAEFLGNITDKNKLVEDVVRQENTHALWEKSWGSPVSITGAFSAITCVRGAVPIFSVKLNYITQTLFIACSAGIFKFQVPSPKEPRYQRITIDDVRSEGERVLFADYNDMDTAQDKRYITFLGKSGYRENFVESRLVRDEDRERLLAYANPGGPSRALYLTQLQPKDQPIGFILANGEKVGEWIHWIPYVIYGRRTEDSGEPALLMFEIHQDRPQMKDGVLMATNPAYSIFLETPTGMVIDATQFARFPNPSKVRSTLLVCLSNNRSVTPIMRQYGYRQIIF